MCDSLVSLYDHLLSKLFKFAHVRGDAGRVVVEWLSHPLSQPDPANLKRSVKVSKAKRAARTPDRRLSEEYTGLIIIRALLIA